MKARCPQCQSEELRLHGVLEQATFERRWGWFGDYRFRRRIKAAEMSCGKCMRTFTVRPDSITESPLQTLSDMLTSREQAASNGKGPRENQGAESAPRPKGPRAAPDPRVKR